MHFQTSGLAWLENWEAVSGCLKAGGNGTTIGLQGVQFSHLEKHVGGLDPVNVSDLLADDTKLSSYKD